MLHDIKSTRHRLSTVLNHDAIQFPKWGLVLPAANESRWDVFEGGVRRGAEEDAEALVLELGGEGVCEGRGHVLVEDAFGGGGGDGDCVILGLGLVG